MITDTDIMIHDASVQYIIFFLTYMFYICMDVVGTLMIRL